MALTFRSRQLRHERAMDTRLTGEHRTLARNVAAIVMRLATTPGRTVPNTRTHRERLKAAIWTLAIRPYYIGRGDDPFNADVPQSPYARLLYDGISGSTQIQAEQQQAFLRRVLRQAQDHDDVVFNWLTGPRPFPSITELRIVSPVNTYDPFHRWIDPNGYRLSDRVWQASINVRSRIDALLDYHIARGTAAVEIADLLEDFLTPGTRLIKTNTPYGLEGSFAARRLARTEITAAAGRATVNASIANPFVKGIQWVLSGSHGKPDICDENAKGGPNGDGVYAPESVPTYPNHPHDKCHLQPVARGDTADLVASLRRDIAASMPTARRIQGLFNAGWLKQAQLSGVLTDVIEGLGV